ncbi:MAG: hypothetical protein K2I04_05885 [Muribaculaceae bacterium]|nr:hypothetical protein [Muribaculaceae bacterium]
MKNNTNTVRNPRLASVGAPVGLLLVLLATIVPFFLRDNALAQTVYPYVYAAGALLLLVVRLFTPFSGSDMRLRRLHRIESWSAVFFCVGAFFQFYPGSTLRDWLAFTLAGAAIQIFTSLAIPARESKLARNKDN